MKPVDFLKLLAMHSDIELIINDQSTDSDFLESCATHLQAMVTSKQISLSRLEITSLIDLDEWLEDDAAVYHRCENLIPQAEMRLNITVSDRHWRQQLGSFEAHGLAKHAWGITVEILPARFVLSSTSNDHELGDLRSATYLQRDLWS